MGRSRQTLASFILIAILPLTTEAISHSLQSLARMDHLSGLSLGDLRANPQPGQLAPQPDYLETIVDSIKKGGRVRIEIQGTQAVAWDNPHQILWERNADRISAILESRTQILQKQIDQTYARGFLLRNAVHLIFSDASKIGDPNHLLGFEIQILMPQNVEPNTFSKDIQDYHGFHYLDGSRIFSRSVNCAQFLKTLR